MTPFEQHTLEAQRIEIESLRREIERREKASRDDLVWVGRLVVVWTVLVFFVFPWLGVKW